MGKSHALGALALAAAVLGSPNTPFGSPREVKEMTPEQRKRREALIKEDISEWNNLDRFEFEYSEDGLTKKFVVHALNKKNALRKFKNFCREKNVKPLTSTLK